MLAEGTAGGRVPYKSAPGVRVEVGLDGGAGVTVSVGALVAVTGVVVRLGRGVGEGSGVLEAVRVAGMGEAAEAEGAVEVGGTGVGEGRAAAVCWRDSCTIASIVACVSMVISGTAGCSPCKEEQAPALIANKIMNPASFFTMPSAGARTG
jgi:hypothetical protein